MFTGIIIDVGVVRAVEQRGDVRFVIGTALAMEKVAIGASIACHGVCLTVVEKGTDADGPWFAVDVSAETLAKSALADWQPGVRVNLEKSLKVGDELGGHIVTGHVDAVGRVVSVTPDGDSKRFSFAAPASLAPYIAQKGSVALNGASLTVNEVADTPEGVTFGVNIIPHTQQWTTFGAVQAGDRINIEIDVLARYVGRMHALKAG